MSLSYLLNPLHILDHSVTSCSWWVHTGRLFPLSAAFVFHVISPLPYSAEASDSPHTPEEGSVIHLLSLHSGLLSEATSPLSPMLTITRWSLWSVDLYFLWK